MRYLLSCFIVIGSYIFGSIPFGVLVARRRGIDLRKAGSGNIGATNVLRTAGRGPALITLLGDSMKGAIAVIMSRQFMGGEYIEGVAGISAVLGHIFPVFLSLKGGKGVATGFGVIAVYTPGPALAALGVWGAVALFSRYSSLAAIITFLFLPLIFVLFDVSKVKIFFAIILAFLIILKHKSNMARILKGSETKIGGKERFIKEDTL